MFITRMDSRCVRVVIASIWLTLSLPAAAEFCGTQCPQIRKSVDLCLIGPITNLDPIMRWSIKSACPDSAQIYLVRNTDEALHLFSKIESSCQSIHSLTFAGHGTPGTIEPAHLNLNTIHKLSPAACLMEPNAKINLKGCNVAKNCHGQLFVYQFARKLLESGGTVRAANGYFGVNRPLSVEFSIGGWTQLNYQPNRIPPDRWQTKRSQISSLAACARDFERGVAYLEKAYKSKEVERCLDRRGFTNQVAKYRTFFKTYSQISNWDIGVGDSDVSVIAEFDDYLQSELAAARACE